MDSRNIMFMFYGFAVVWICLAAYAVSLGARERTIRQQIDGLKKLVEDRGAKS